MDVINVLDVMNVKDVTDIMDVLNEINGLNARAWVPVFVFVIVFVFVFYCIMQLVTVRAPTIVVMRVQMALMITRQFSLRSVIVVRV